MREIGRASRCRGADHGNGIEARARARSGSAHAAARCGSAARRRHPRGRGPRAARRVPGSSPTSTAAPSSPVRASSRPASFSSTASRLIARSAHLHHHLAHDVLVEVRLGVEHRALLAQLDLVQHEHHEDAQPQRDQRRIEGDAEAGDHARHVALDRLVRLLQRFADAAHGADEADRGDRPRDVAHHRQFRVEPVELEFARVVDRRRNVLDVARGAEAVQAAQQRARQQFAAHVVGQRLDLPRVVARVLGQDLHALRQPQQVRCRAGCWPRRSENPL